MYISIDFKLMEEEGMTEDRPWTFIKNVLKVRFHGKLKYEELGWDWNDVFRLMVIPMEVHGLYNIVFILFNGNDGFSDQSVIPFMSFVWVKWGEILFGWDGGEGETCFHLLKKIV